MVMAADHGPLAPMLPRRDIRAGRHGAKKEDAMRITILGGGGFLGRKLAHRLAADGTLDGRTGHRPDPVRPGRRRRR